MQANFKESDVAMPEKVIIKRHIDPASLEEPTTPTPS
jgi:hypothetical protein